MNEERINIENSEEVSERRQKEKHHKKLNYVEMIRLVRQKAAKVSDLLVVLCVVLVVLFVVQIVQVGRLSAELSEMRDIHQAIYDKSQTIEVAGESDRIREDHYSLGEVAIPALQGVPVSKYKDENFSVDEKGFLHYYQDGELCSYVGIDVSAHNGDIDWNKVKADGVDFVMLRIGGRGYGSEGVIYEDSYFLSNLRNAKKAGLYVGAYFFSQAVNAEEAREEALYCISVLGGEKLDYPLAFDWEIIEGDDARTDGTTPRALTGAARAFCDTVKDAGYMPCLYTGSTLAYYKYDLAQLSDVDIWYAFYNDSPDMYYNYMICQYSCTGRVDGITGDVDLNICFKNYK